MEWLLLLPVLGFVWPWQSVDPETGIVLDTTNEQAYGPYLPPNWDSGEFGPLQPVANVVSKVTANVSRLASKAANDPSGQTTTASGSGSGIWAKLTGAATTTGDFVQSTLTKVIIIVAIVAVAALFLSSYIQAKGASLAK